MLTSNYNSFGYSTPPRTVSGKDTGSPSLCKTASSSVQKILFQGDQETNKPTTADPSRLESSASRRELNPVSVKLGNIEEFLRKELDKRFEEIRVLRQEKGAADYQLAGMKYKIQDLEHALQKQQKKQSQVSAVKEQQLQDENKVLREQVDQLIKEKNTLIQKIQVISKAAAAESAKPIVSQSAESYRHYESALNDLRSTKHQLEREAAKYKAEVQRLSDELEQAYLSSGPRIVQGFGDEETLINLQKQNMALKQQLMNSKKMGFDDVLKSHFEEKNYYKESLNDRIEEIKRLEEINREQKFRLDAFSNEIEVEKLKAMSERKAMEVQFETDRQVFMNQIHTLTKSLNVLSQKLKIFIDENNRKDDFIKQWVLGKVYNEQDKLNVLEFLSRYDLAVPANHLHDALMGDVREMEELRREVHSLRLIEQQRRMENQFEQQPAY